MRKTISALLAVTIFVSCTKHKGDMDDHAPTATLSFLNQPFTKTFRTGDTVRIQAVAISTATMHGYDIIIKKQSDTTTCYFLHGHDHNDTININKVWVNNMSGPHKMDAFIKVYLDHNGHTLTGKAPFSIE